MPTREPSKGDPLEVDDAGRSPIWYAAMEGDLAKLGQYLTKGADPNIGDHERVTPLFIAACNGRLEAVKLLLEHGADPNLTDCNGTAMLQLATHEAGLARGTKDHLAVVALLLQYGADPDHKNKWGAGPRDFAKRGNVEIQALYSRYELRQGELPGPGRKAPTPREADGTKDENYYWSVHARLWEELVPPKGQAKTVQGEIIRITGKLTREAYTNGNINWDNATTKLWQFVAETLDDPATFTAAERAQIKQWIQTIVRDCNCPDVSGEGSPYYLITEKAVAWVVAHPKPLPHIPDPNIGR